MTLGIRSIARSRALCAALSAPLALSCLAPGNASDLAAEEWRKALPSSDKALIYVFLQGVTANVALAPLLEESEIELGAATEDQFLARETAPGGYLLFVDFAYKTAGILQVHLESGKAHFFVGHFRKPGMKDILTPATFIPGLPGAITGLALELSKDRLRGREISDLCTIEQVEESVGRSLLSERALSSKNEAASTR